KTSTADAAVAAETTARERGAVQEVRSPPTGKPNSSGNRAAWAGIGQVFIERALTENRAGYRPTSRCLACRPSCLEISPHLEGNLEPRLRVQSRYWSTDIGRPKIAETFVCIFRYRTLPLKTGS